MDHCLGNAVASMMDNTSKAHDGIIGVSSIDAEVVFAEEV